MSLEEKAIHMISKGMTLVLVGAFGAGLSMYQHSNLNQKQEIIKEIYTQNPQCIVKVPNYDEVHRKMDYLLYGSSALVFSGFALFNLGEILEARNKNIKKK